MSVVEGRMSASWGSSEVSTGCSVTLSTNQHGAGARQRMLAPQHKHSGPSKRLTSRDDCSMANMSWLPLPHRKGEGYILVPSSCCFVYE